MKNDKLGLEKNNIVDDLKMQEVAAYLQEVLPNHGFALMAFEIENGSSHGKYISNVTDDFMIKALEFQVKILKDKVYSAPQIPGSDL